MYSIAEIYMEQVMNVVFILTDVVQA